MKRKKIIAISLVSIAALILIASAVLIFSGNVITVARCIVAEGGEVFMIYRDSPVRLNGADADGIYTGDILFILRSGAIAQSYPGQAFPYFTVRLAKGDSSKVPGDVISSLESLGRHIILNADTPPSVYTELTVAEITTSHLLLSGSDTAETYRVPNWFSPSAEVKTGDRITVHHSGEVREIYPAEFAKIYRMTLKGSDGREISVLPAMRGE